MIEPSGWICPKCGRVYAPWVKECEACNPVKVAPTPEPWTLPYPWYPYPWTVPVTPTYPGTGYPTVTWGGGGTYQ